MSTRKKRSRGFWVGVVAFVVAPLVVAVVDNELEDVDVFGHILGAIIGLVRWVDGFSGWWAAIPTVLAIWLAGQNWKLTAQLPSGEVFKEHEAIINGLLVRWTAPHDIRYYCPKCELRIRRDRIWPTQSPCDGCRHLLPAVDAHYTERVIERQMRQDLQPAESSQND